MAVVRGIFVLGEVVEEKFSNTWTNLGDVWIDVSSPNVGHFANDLRIDKLTYSTDITLRIPSISLSLYRYDLAATGNSTNGYFGGGSSSFGGIVYSTIDKLTYLSDTIIAAPTANLSLARGILGATGNSTAGYFGGGAAAGPSYTPYSRMDKLTYSTDTTQAAPSSANLSLARYGLAATGNTSAGYFAGGGIFSPLTQYSIVDKIFYSTDLTAVLPSSANLSLSRGGLAATGNSTAGYFGGGFPGPQSRMDKLTYSSDTTSLLPGSLLSVARTDLAATGNSAAGYFGGGSWPSIPISYSTMDKLTYSSDTTVFTPTANLSSSRGGDAASSPKANALPQNLWRRFSDGFETTNPALIPQATPTPQTALVSYSRAGYFGGGINANISAIYSTMDKLTYSTDTTVAALSGANLSVPRYYIAATGNSTAGYFSGGASPGAIVVSTTDKLTYSTDTTVASPGANSSLALYYIIAAGNLSAGYFAGGYSPQTSIIDKLNYSTEQTSLLPGTNLTQPRSGFSGVGNLNAGYFAGDLSNPATTTIDKLTYSTETVASLAPTYLKFSRQLSAATGNSTAGYFSGGASPGTVPASTMEKLTYSTDTTVYTPSANLSLARYRLAATGSSTAGYFGGGLRTGPLSVSTMDKLTYSTDTTAAAPSGANLSLARHGLAASSNGSNGFPQSAILPVIV